MDKKSMIAFAKAYENDCVEVKLADFIGDSIESHIGGKKNCVLRLSIAELSTMQYDGSFIIHCDFEHTEMLKKSDLSLVAIQLEKRHEIEGAKLEYIGNLLKGRFHLS